MNIICFSLFIILSILGIKKNLENKRISYVFHSVYSLFFVICGLSRIGNSKEYSDLTHYLDYFRNDISTYFEPGYLYLTYLIKVYFNDSPYSLITVVGLIILICIYLCSIVLSKKEDRNIHDRMHFHYGFIMIAVFLTYWGLAFEAERLRIGIATSLILVSLVLILYRKKLLPLVLIILALTFQFTIIVIIPVLILAGIVVNRDSPFLLNRNVFLIWFFILVCSRLFLNLIGSVGPIVLIMDRLQTLITTSELNHYDSYVSQSIYDGSGIISLKEIFYYVCGYFMICHGTKFLKYNIIVLIYFIGLTSNVFLVGFDAGHRISDMFLSVNCIAVAYMGWLTLFSKKSYWLYLLAIIISQSVMSINYLGISL